MKKYFYFIFVSIFILLSSVSALSFIDNFSKNNNLKIINIETWWVPWSTTNKFLEILKTRFLKNIIKTEKRITEVNEELIEIRESRKIIYKKINSLRRYNPTSKHRKRRLRKKLNNSYDEHSRICDKTNELYEELKKLHKKLPKQIKNKNLVKNLREDLETLVLCFLIVAVIVGMIIVAN